MKKIEEVVKFECIIILSLYFGLLFVFSDFSISAVWGALFLCACSCVCFFQYIYNRKQSDRKWEIIDLLLLFFVFLTLFNFIRVFEFNRTIIYYFLILINSCIMFWTCKIVTSKSIDKSKKIIVSIAGIFSIVNIVCFFSRSFIEKIIFPILSKTSKDYYIRMYNEGYGFPFGEDIGYTAVVIAMGVGIICISITRENWLKKISILFVLFWGLLLVQRRGEVIVCLIDLVLVIFIGNIQERKIIRKSEQSMMFFKASYIVPQVICIVFTLIFFSITTEHSRYSETMKSMTESMDESISETDEEKDLNPLKDNEKTDGYFNEEFSGKKADESGKNDNGNEYLIEKVEELGNGRLILWELAWQAFLEKPWFGNGWGSFAKIAPKSGNVRATNAHCIYLQLLCETGIIGFLLIGSIFFIIFILIMKKIWNCKSIRYLKNYQFVLYIFFFVLGHGVIDNSLYYTYEIILFIIALMVIFRVEDEKNEKSDVNIRNETGSH